MFWFGLRRALGWQVTGLIQSGPYRVTRNPQLAGFGLVVLGAVVLWPSWYALGWAALYGLVGHLMVVTEEEHLLAVFGEEYARYCRRVPRYVGLWWKGRRRPPNTGCADGRSAPVAELVSGLYPQGQSYPHAESFKLGRNNSFQVTAELLGFDQTEVAVIAATALFHRKSLAGPKRAEFAALDRRSQKVVRTLSMLLRLAENLNRGHTNVVRHAALRAVSSRKLALSIRAAGDCQLELWGVQSNQAAFEKELGRAITLELVTEP